MEFQALAKRHLQVKGLKGLIKRLVSPKTVFALKKLLKGSAKKG